MSGQPNRSGTVRNPALYCIARRSDGGSCQNYPIRGSDRCRFHGMNTEAARAKAAQTQAIVEAAATFPGTQRWLAEELRPRALARLLEIVTDPEASHADLLRVAQLVLDRTGFGPGAHLEIEHTAGAPLELLQRALNGIATRHELANAQPDYDDAIEVEVIEDEYDLSAQLAALDDALAEPQPIREVVQSPEPVGIFAPVDRKTGLAPGRW